MRKKDKYTTFVIALGMVIGSVLGYVAYVNHWIS